jgi:pimeloyl-ACP methyl ester carboxylesterase
MPRVTANGIEIEYESLGPDQAPVALLIMGLGCQLIHWPDALCEQLLAAGYRVLRYDNRDVGLSSRMEQAGMPKLLRAGIAARLRLPVRAAYGLDDLAADALGLMDALGIAQAHVVGLSMGGMIAQVLGAKHANRVRSLTLIMTSSGNPWLKKPSLRIQMRMMSKPKARDRETLLQFGMNTWRMIGSPGYPSPEPELREYVARALDRNVHPQGLARQMVAIMASGSRVKQLARIKAPTLIIHGDKDPLVPVPAARDLKKHIPDAQLEIIHGMGHDLPSSLLPKLSHLILHHTKHAERAHGRRAA